MTGWLWIALASVVASRPVAAPVQKPHTLGMMPMVSDFALTVSPATISFSATNPGTLPVVSGSSAATASWHIYATGNTWDLKVQAPSPAFANCPTVPVSAVTVSCSSATVGGATGSSAACAAPFPLSTTAQTVASGSEGTGAWNYSATITFTLADSWQHIAETSPACTISLTYTATVP